MHKNIFSVSTKLWEDLIYPEFDPQNLLEQLVTPVLWEAETGEPLGLTGLQIWPKIEKKKEKTPKSYLQV